MDETQNWQGDFTVGGFVGPEHDWKRHFEPAWDERVLDGKVRIPYFHMTDIRSFGWRTANGITGVDAESRTDEAINVIRSMGSIYPLSSGMKISEFKSIFADPLIKLGGGRWEIVKDPDYLCFIAFATLAVRYAHEMLPDCTRVDFLVEHSQKSTENVKGFHHHLVSTFKPIPYASRLLGGISSGNKTSIPLQAADVLCWYVQRKEANNLKGIDERRFWKLVKHHGYSHATTKPFLIQLSAHLQAGMRKRGMGTTKKNEDDAHEQYSVRCCVPADLTPAETARCLAIVLEGDAVDRTVKSQLPVATLLAVVRKNQHVVGVGAIKRVRPDYAAKIVKRSGHVFPTDMPELGYVARSKGHFGHSLAPRILGARSTCPDRRPNVRGGR